MHLSYRLFFAVVLTIVAASSASAQPGVVAQWTFPNMFSVGAPAPSTGSGSATILGTSGSSAAGIISTTDFAWNLTNFPLSGAGSGTEGAQFQASTSLFGPTNDVIIRFEERHSGTASRFMQLQYTTDGTNFITTGLTNNGVYAIPIVDTFFPGQTFDLSGLAAVNNNPNFGFRVVAVFDPAGSNYAATNQGSTYASGGTVRLDNVTVSSAHRWVGGSGTDLAAAGNYAGSAPAPTATSTLLFNGATNTTVTAAAPQSVGQILFGSGAASHNLSGQALTLTGGGIVNQSTATQTIGNDLDLTARPQAISSDIGGHLIINGNVVIPSLSLFSSENGQLYVTGSGTVTVNGVISGASTTAEKALVKAGTGTLILTAANTYPASSGGTQVQQGTLLVNNTSGSGTGPGSVTVGTGGIGGTLGGTGTIAGSISVLSTASLAPGDGGIGTLHTGGNVTLNGNSTLLAELGASGSSDKIDLTAPGGTLNLLTNSRLGLIAMPGFGGAASYDLATLQNGTNIQLGGAGQVDGFVFGTYVQGTGATGSVVIDVSNLGITLATGDTFVLSRAGNNLVLTFTPAPVPEPTTVLALSAAGLGLVGLVRRARRKRAAV